MTKFILFAGGVILGVYIDQTYKVPKIQTIISKISDELKKHQK
jgi:hypothetical protein